MAEKMQNAEFGRNTTENLEYVPHRGSLCKVKQLTKKVEKNSSPAVEVNSLESSIDLYAITIQVTRDDGMCVDMRTTAGTGTHELHFKSEQYSFMENLFSILDTESTGIVNKVTLQEFVMLRCPVFKRRDYDILQYQKNRDNCKTADNCLYGTVPHSRDGDIDCTDSEFLSFELVWKAVISCALETDSSIDYRSDTTDTIGIEAWMIFCRFISLAQYLDAKRRFSGRHLQTLQNRQISGTDLEEEDQEQELIIVDLPPLEKPTPLDVYALLDYEYATRGKGGIPLPELDLDHSYISLHDESKKLRLKETAFNGIARQVQITARPVVEVSVFGNEHDINKATGNYLSVNELEFIIRFAPSNEDMSNCENVVIVRRSFKDLEWLHHTFESHKNLGGTLCGRILPPFPSKIVPTSSSVDDSGYGTGSSLGSIANSSNRTAVAVASAGVGMVSSAAKTAKTLFWGGLSSSKNISTPVVSVVKKAIKSRGLGPSSLSTTSKVVPTTLTIAYSKQNSFLKKSTNTAGSKAKQLERYLNYFLGHPALSSSFPLNLILKASQSGLEAARKILDDQSQKSSSISVYLEKSSPERDVVSSYYSLLQYLPTPTQTTNLEWVRTAAQAALVLKVHGLLETAGYQSSSTTLQHASLPQFSSPKAGGSRDSNESINDGDGRDVTRGSDDNNRLENVGRTSSRAKFDDDKYECDGFDILPENIPISERSALCAGSSFAGNKDCTDEHLKPPLTPINVREKADRDLYGVSDKCTSLGDIEVERDIERLRDLLQKVDKGFAMSYKALGTIGEKRHARAQLQINILRGVDSWEGMRGKILAQRSLLNGVNCLEEASRHSDGCYVIFSEDMLWNASLARSAVTASNEVCHAVEAAKTASRAKRTADSAVLNATQLETYKAETPDTTKALAERGSKLQMQALHAAVVEHEAQSAKKRSVISLANDMKCWNSHRKSKLLQACINDVRSQKLASQQSLIAWRELKGGLLETRRSMKSKVVLHNAPPMGTNITGGFGSQYDDIDSCCGGFDTNFERESRYQDEEQNCEQNQISRWEVPTQTQKHNNIEKNQHHNRKKICGADCHINPETLETTKRSSPSTQTTVLNDFIGDVQQDYFTPTPSENDDILHADKCHSECDYADAQDSSSDHFEDADSNRVTACTSPSKSNFVTALSNDFEVQQKPLDGGTESDIDDRSSCNLFDHTNAMSAPMSTMQQHCIPSNALLDDIECDRQEIERGIESDNDGMADSMQSLVDSLLQWGGNWDEDDMDINLLPQGMAASLAMEERAVLDLQ
uniref:Uncharacterized protein n=2 Tax=Chaetoceros debilis TaxID=122233 RepID=A0A7S3Q170_9STRA|eukprot:CAMPEP_0194115874 /NCGR_PEP_ID=MMETSP0150-20130528/24704_1 /TAXON_ID=122233 /ORGANISM="Chaetoceros debilis, Strain MM31A-1" /LENGTH=1289 /DNA_ID=CAMNT_0038806441 /DNA_START=464 /DNA_END=4336 /DNA_ORIENTATION=+